MKTPSLVLVLGIIALAATEVFAQGVRPKGVFTGTLLLSPQKDGLTMRVAQPITYNDGEGHELDVPAGFVTDGASIPRALWSIVGSPFAGGGYVEAAVVHDEGCISRKYSWQVTHTMFYTAMIDSGVSEDQAKILYYGVRLGGPRWKTIEANGKVIRVVDVPSEPMSEDAVEAFAISLVERENSGNPISIQEINDMHAPRPIRRTH